MRSIFLRGMFVFVFIVSCASQRVHGQTAGSETAIDPEPRITYKYGQNMRFGVSVLKDQAGKPVSKKLTYNDDGGTNSTVVRIDGKDTELGGGNGNWVEKDVKLPADPTRLARDGSRSIWTSGNVKFTQIIEIVASNQPVEVAPGVQKRLYDTCLVRYILENTDNKVHNAGLRFQLDTLIGSNDGVPFAVPGVAGLVNTMRDFPTPGNVPDFAQALENADLQKPGTISHLTLKVGGSIEPPSRVSLTHWPGNSGSALAWDIPMITMGSDSAVVMYWNERPLQPGESRMIGFAYGLAAVSSAEGKLGLTVSGAFEVGQSFTVAAYVHNPAKGEALTVRLPDGLALAEGNQTQDVPPLAADTRDGNSVVSWKVRSQRAGQFPVNVRSSVGSEASKTVTISEATITTGKQPQPKQAGPSVPGQAQGKVTFLLVQDHGRSYGPPQGELDTEVVFRLDSEPDRLFGFHLGEDRPRQDMLELLRDAVNAQRPIHVDYEAQKGRTNGIVFRVWIETMGQGGSTRAGN